MDAGGRPPLPSTPTRGTPTVMTSSSPPPTFDMRAFLESCNITPSKIDTTARQLLENDIDESLLLGTSGERLTMDELRECGLVSVGLRKRILSGAKTMRARMLSTPRSSTPAGLPPTMSPIMSPPILSPLAMSPMSVAMDPAVLESQILVCACSADFELVRNIASGQNGSVFAARCTRSGLPRPDKLYALKLCFNFGLSTAAARNTFENEFNVLSRLPPHPNVTRFYAQFIDEIPDAALEHLPRFAREQADYTSHTGQVQRRKAQFLVTEYHPETFRNHRALLPVPLPYGACLRFTIDLLKAVVHLQTHRTAHLDLKFDNMLVSTDGRLVLCDFGTAVQFETDDMLVEYSPAMCVGGNVMHLAPEVLNEHDRLRRLGRGARGVINYRQQEVWAVGALIHTMVFGSHPWPDYPNGCGGAGSISYSTTSLPPYPSDYPDGFRDLVVRMLAFDPDDRLPIEDALVSFSSLPLPPSILSLDDDTQGAPSIVDLCGPDIRVTIRYISGATTTVVVEEHSTVTQLMRAALDVFLPEEDHSTSLTDHRVLYAGRLLPMEGVVGALGLDRESCVHLVRKPTTHHPVVRRASMSSASSTSRPSPPGPQPIRHTMVPGGVPPAAGSPPASITDSVSPMSTPQSSSSSGRPAGGDGAKTNVNNQASNNNANNGAGSASASPLSSTSKSPSAGAGAPTLPSNAGAGSAPTNQRGREMRPDDVDTTLIRFRQVGFSSDVKFDNDGATTETAGKWVTVMADMEGISHGKLEWELQLDEAKPGAGLAIGVADLSCFYPSMQNLGVGEGSWCYSKTGQASIGGTSGFSDYGATFTHNSRVGLVLDMDAGTLRFIKDGVDQGLACCWGLRGRVLTPGIVMGTNKGGKLTKVSVFGSRKKFGGGAGRGRGGRIPFRIISHFNSRTTPGSIILSNSQRTATTTGTWASLLVNPGEAEADVCTMVIRVDEAKPGAGLGIGLANLDEFDYKRHILGVSAGSWCYSKTGQSSCGSGFHDYGSRFTTGDVVCMVLNRREGSLTFYKGGENQGVAFDSGLKDKRLVPALVLGSSLGGKLTKVTLDSSLDSLPAEVLALSREQKPKLLI